MSLLFSASAYQLYEEPLKDGKQPPTSSSSSSAPSNTLFSQLGPVAKAQIPHDGRLLDRFTDRADFDAMPQATILAARAGIAGKTSNIHEKQAVLRQWAEGGIGGAIPIDKNVKQNKDELSQHTNNPNAIEAIGVIPIKKEDREYRSACVAPRTLSISKHGTLYICDELGDLVLEALPINSDVTAIRALLALNTRALTEQELRTVREADEREAGLSWSNQVSGGNIRKEGYDREMIQRIDAQNTVTIPDTGENSDLLTSGSFKPPGELSLSSRRPFLSSPPPPSSRRLTFLSSLSVEMNGISIICRHMEPTPVMPALSEETLGLNPNLQGSFNESFLVGSGSGSLVGNRSVNNITSSFVANGSMTLSRSRARSVLGDAAAGVEAMLAAQQLQQKLNSDHVNNEIEMFTAKRFIFANASEAAKFAAVLRQFVSPQIYQQESLQISKQRELMASLVAQQQNAIAYQKAQVAAKEEAALARKQRRKARGQSIVSNSTFSSSQRPGGGGDQFGQSPDDETPRSTLLDIRSTLNDDTSTGGAHPYVGQLRHMGYGRFDNITTPPNNSIYKSGELARPSLECPPVEDKQARKERQERDELELSVLLNALLSKSSTLSTPLSSVLGNKFEPTPTNKNESTRPPSVTSARPSGVNAAFLSNEDQHAADMELAEMMKYAHKDRLQELANTSSQVLYPNFSLGPHFEHLEHMQKLRKEEEAKKARCRKATVEALAASEQRKYEQLQAQKLRPIMNKDGSVMLVEENQFQNNVKQSSKPDQQVYSQHAIVDGSLPFLLGKNKFAVENQNGEVIPTPTVNGEDFEILRRKAQLNILQGYQQDDEEIKPQKSEVQRIQEQMKEAAAKSQKKSEGTSEQIESVTVVGQPVPPQHFFDPTTNRINLNALSASIPTQNPALVSRRAQLVGNTISLQAPYPNFYPKFGTLDHSQHKYTTLVNRQEEIEYETFTRPQIMNTLNTFLGDVHNGHRWNEQQQEIERQAKEIELQRKRHDATSENAIDRSLSRENKSDVHLTSGSFVNLSLVRAVNSSIVSQLPASFALSSGHESEVRLGGTHSIHSVTDTPSSKPLMAELTSEGKVLDNDEKATLTFHRDSESPPPHSPTKRQSLVSLSKAGELSAENTSIFAISMASIHEDGKVNENIELVQDGKKGYIPAPKPTVQSPNNTMWQKHVDSRPDHQAAQHVIAKLRDQLKVLNDQPIHAIATRERLQTLAPSCVPAIEARRLAYEQEAMKNVRILDRSFQNQVNDYVYPHQPSQSQSSVGQIIRPKWMTENISYSPPRTTFEAEFVHPIPPSFQPMLPPPPPPPTFTMMLS